VNKECEDYTMITELHAGHVDNSVGKATPVFFFLVSEVDENELRAHQDRTRTRRRQ
jgi:hypothetical protein